MKTLLYKNWSVSLVLIYIAIIIVYSFFNGPSSLWFQIHDNLDSNMVYYKMLKDNDAFFDSSSTIPFLGGSVHASGLVSPLKLTNIPFLLFDPDIALIVNYIVSIFIALLGGILFGKEALGKEWGSYKHIIILVSFCFGILPVFPATQICAASIPLLVWAIFRLYKTSDKKMYIVVFMYPTLSSFALFEIFICGYIFLFFVFSSFFKKSPQWNIIFSLLVFIGGMIVFDWTTFYTFIFSDVPSIRETIQYGTVDFSQSIKEFLFAFVFGQYHCASSHTFVVFPICTAYVLVQNYRYFKKRKYIQILKDPFNWFYLWGLFNALMYGLNDWSTFRNFISSILPPLSGFSFARTLWFNGFIWYFMFAILLIRLTKSAIKHKWAISYVVAFSAIICVILTPQTYNTIQLQFKNLYLETTGQTTDFTFDEFYSSDLFNTIKQDINYSNEWSIAVGLHPAVLEYNEISTLDGYLSSYPQYYKDQFAKLIQPELETNPDAKAYFENWGGRAYIFNSELPYAPKKEAVDYSIKLKIDPIVFKEMNGVYVFSRAKLSNYAELDFSFVGEYSNDSSPYCIFVYKSDHPHSGWSALRI